MIELHSRIFENLAWKNESFSRYIQDHINRLSEYKRLEDLKESYNSVSLSHTIKYFGQYISNFEVVVGFILSRKNRKGNQDKYLRIYFSQLSNSEKVFLLYYYNLVEKPVFWERCKDLLFGSLYSNHLHQPMHADILDGISDMLDKMNN